MACKTTWDYAYYWAILAKLFFAGDMLDPRLIEIAGRSLLQARSLNQQIQTRFRARASEKRQEEAHGRFVDQCQIPCLWQLNADLGNGSGTLAQDVAVNVEMLERLSNVLLSILDERPGRNGELAERELVGDLRQRLAA